MAVGWLPAWDRAREGWDGTAARRSLRCSPAFKGVRFPPASRSYISKRFGSAEMYLRLLGGNAFTSAVYFLNHVVSRQSGDLTSARNIKRISRAVQPP